MSILSDVGEFIGDKIKKLKTLYVALDPESITQIESLIEKIDDKLSSLLNDVAFAANNFLTKSEKIAKELIDKAFEKLSKLGEEVENIVNNILTKITQGAQQIVQSIKNDLLEPLIANLDKLRQALVEDISKLIDKIDVAVTGTIENIDFKIRDFKNEILDKLSIFFWNMPWDSDPCRVELGIQGVPNSELDPSLLYELQKCRTLQRYDEEKEFQDLKVNTLQAVYSSLAHSAWSLACLARGTPPLKIEATEDWIKYGQIHLLWNQFEENMKPLEALEEKIRQLQKLENKIDDFQAKATQIEGLLQGKKVCSGQTPAGNTDWEVYNTQLIKVKIDTSKCGFQSTPIYIVNVHGDDTNVYAIGGSSAYERTEKGFEVLVGKLSKDPMEEFKPQTANEWKWHIQWIAIGN